MEDTRNMQNFQNFRSLTGLAGLKDHSCCRKCLHLFTQFLDTSQFWSLISRQKNTGSWSIQWYSNLATDRVWHMANASVVWLPANYRRCTSQCRGRHRVDTFDLLIAPFLREWDVKNPQPSASAGGAQQRCCCGLHNSETGWNRDAAQWDKQKTARNTKLESVATYSKETWHF